LDRVDEKGIVLLLGKGRFYTPLTWECLEGIVPFLRRRPGWVSAGGTFVVDRLPTDLVGRIYKSVDFDSTPTIETAIHAWIRDDLGLGSCSACPPMPR